MGQDLTALPTTERWRPTRAGIVGLWRYWDETFTFHRGRLLLRGPNGSGKSMALELLLPFLLDADASPGRLTSAAKSRGGLYERVMTGGDGASRTGFAWVEFVRGSDVCTAGVRIRAKESTRKVDLDFFTTSQSVGADLHLLDDKRTPLSRKELVQAIGERGAVYGSAEEYRTAVRTTLFPGFGVDHYASVVTALLALRKEKLSQNLDLDKLSDVLSEALPAIDDHDLAAVAEGFERLDRRRAELDAVAAELDEVTALATREREYAQAMLAALAGDVRATETRRDAVTRAEREARAALEDAQREALAVATELNTLERRLSTIDVEVETLKASDAYRDGASLVDLRAETGRLRQLAERDRRTVTERAAERTNRQDRMEEARRQHETATSNATLATDELRGAAPPVGAEAAADEAIALDPDEGERLLQAWERALRTRMEEMRQALAAHRQAVQQRDFADGQVRDDQDTIEQRHTARRQAIEAAVAAADSYAQAVTGWAASCAAVGTERITEALPPSLTDPPAVVAAVAGLREEVMAEHAVAARDLAAARETVEGERAVLVAERAPLADGRMVEPAAPLWRSEREGRPGAPLWRLVDVQAGTSAAQADGLEAALVAAGLLDAWVTPAGTLDLGTDAADLVLGRRPVPGRSLADVLVPLGSTAVPSDVVAGVLASVALIETVGEGTDSAGTGGDGADAPEVVMGLDGTFRLGAAGGRGALRPAELLGAEAQERRRLARLAEIDAAIADADGRLAQLEREAANADARRDAAVADLDAMPDGVPVAEAAAQVARAETRLSDAEDRLAQSRAALAEAEEAVRQALRALTTTGARHQLPTTEEGLDAIAESLQPFTRSVTTWARRAREVTAADRARQEAATELARAEDGARRAEADLDATERQVAEAETKLAALESTIGAEYQQLIDRLEGLGQERQVARDRRHRLSGDQPKLERRVGTLEQGLADAEQARDRAEEERATAHRRFGAAFAGGLAADAELALPDAPLDGVTAVLAAGRAIATQLEAVACDGPAIERASSRVQERLHHAQAAIGGRADLSREATEEGWWLVRTVAGGVRGSAAALAETLERELAAGRAELAADEERLFEQTLAGSIRRALAERIRLANQLVDGINRQLGTVRTAAGGVHVRLRWEVQPDQPESVRAARSLLLRDPADLTDEQRTSLQEFVRARVDQARADVEATAPWEARLRETLDYRSWHHFVLQIAHRDWEGFQPATRKRLQRLSTGERSIVLHLPMLAAIAAHYSDGAGHATGCPRLILLDELFAGVDMANRAQLFGTFTAWDLDAVFTSDHEWCQYATLDGIAIHHLHPATGEEPVTSTRFTWDGRAADHRPGSVSSERSRGERTAGGKTARATGGQRAG